MGMAYGPVFSLGKSFDLFGPWYASRPGNVEQEDAPDWQSTMHPLKESETFFRRIFGVGDVVEALANSCDGDARWDGGIEKRFGAELFVRSAGVDDLDEVCGDVYTQDFVAGTDQCLRSGTAPQPRSTTSPSCLPCWWSASTSTAAALRASAPNPAS